MSAAAYRILRSALATTSKEHFHALRQISPTPDPRLVAAESVATAAAALIQLPALWLMAEASAALADKEAEIDELLQAMPLAPTDMARLLNRIDALDRCVRAWTQEIWK